MLSDQYRCGAVSGITTYSIKGRNLMLKVPPRRHMDLVDHKGRRPDRVGIPSTDPNPGVTGHVSLFISVENRTF